jgi:hypothetical protein
VDPGRHGVVVRESELVGFGGERESFDEAGLAVDPGEAASAVFEAAVDDFEAEAGTGLQMEAEEGGVEVCAERIDVMKEEELELGALLQQPGQGAVPEEVGDLVPMSDRMQALQGKVVGVVGGLAGRCRPVEEGLAEAVADLLLLFVQALLGHFLPGEPEVADGGDESQADAAAGREEEGSGELKVGVLIEEGLNGLVGEVAGGDQVGGWGAGGLARATAFGEVDFEEGTVLSGEAAERIERLDHARALRPARCGTGREGDHGDFPLTEEAEAGGFEGLLMVLS